MMSINQRPSIDDDPTLHDSLLHDDDDHHNNTQLLKHKPSLVSIEDDEETQKKKFIFSLVCQLHRAGNFSFRTEVYIQQVALEFNLHATCAVFPVSAMISFQETAQLNPQSCEAYNITISSGYDCSKLSRLDQLCFDIQQGKVDFHSAKAILTEIEQAGT